MRGERVDTGALAARQSAPLFPSCFKHVKRPARQDCNLADRLGLALLLGGLLVATASLWAPRKSERPLRLRKQGLKTAPASMRQR